MNGHGWALAVEKALGVPAPPRAEAVRVILSEFSRIMDHIVCITANVVDLGAITPFFVMFRAREAVYDLLEACCGARLTVSYVRIGGLADDVPADFAERCRAAYASCLQSWKDAHELLTRNLIFVRRFRDVGVMSKQDALSWGWVGPCLRGSGVDYDVRKDHPYSGYEEYDFDVPVGTVGDCYDRYLVRMEEMRQSLRIIEQALARLPRRPGADRRPHGRAAAQGRGLLGHRGPHEPLQADHGRDPAARPARSTATPRAPTASWASTSSATAASNPGGSRSGPPSFNLFQAFPHMIRGEMLADAVAIDRRAQHHRRRAGQVARCPSARSTARRSRSLPAPQ